MVFHAFLPNSQQCAQSAFVSWFSNLPGNGLDTTKSTCDGIQNELRLYADNPEWLSTAPTYPYQVQGTYEDRDVVRQCNELNIDNYWVRMNDPLGQVGVNKDNMAKFFYRTGGVQVGNCP